MVAVSALPRADADHGPAPETGRRLAVTWQHPDSRAIQPVGMLEHDGDRYHFHYIRRAQYVEDFRPFLGFPDLGRAYTSAHLFPIFAERVMDARRPDYPHNRPAWATRA